jgi:hypothetical protein
MDKDQKPSDFEYTGRCKLNPKYAEKIELMCVWSEGATFCYQLVEWRLGKLTRETAHVHEVQRP